MPASGETQGEGEGQCDGLAAAAVSVFEGPVAFATLFDALLCLDEAAAAVDDDAL